MRVAVMGTGGVGGYFGGLLAAHGHDVTFIARGAHLAAIQAHGLQIESVNGDFSVAPAQATDTPGRIGLVDLVLLCVKTYDLPMALQQIAPLVGPQTRILTLQNGIEAPDIASATYGAERVLPGVVYCEVAVKAPGVIMQGTPLRRIVLGEQDGRRSERALAIGEAFQSAGAEVVVSENIQAALWTKCCFICAMSGVTTLMRQPLGMILADPETRMLLRIVMQEAEAVAWARGVHFPSDPVAEGMATAARFPYGAKSSMLRDLEAGRRLEVDALNGALVRLGRALDVPTPANHTIYAALRHLQPAGAL
jgi:2-dehydropantoate 2-reductase